MAVCEWAFCEKTSFVIQKEKLDLGQIFTDISSWTAALLSNIYWAIRRLKQFINICTNINTFLHKQSADMSAY